MTTAIDLFAGLGGFTEGARQAGVRVVWAANHWRDAVDVHAANHPDTEHACQDLQQADFTAVPRHDILLASPSCQGHSRARGADRPHHEAARATAWAVVTCAEVHRPRVVVVENVTDWTRWVLWPAWCDAMRSLGYAISPHVLNAADFGVPQERVRLVVVATRSKAPLVLKLRRERRRSAESIIEWGADGWRRITGELVERTRERIAHGRRHHGARFVFSYYGNTRTARDLARPIGTITTHDRWAVVDGRRMRMLNVNECRKAMGFPDTYRLPSSSTLAKHMLGNAVPPPMVGRVLRAIQRAA